MHCTVLRTATNSCIPIYETIGELDHQLTDIIYDAGWGGDYAQLPAMVANTNPDWVLMIGCCDDEGKNIHVPPVEILKQIGEKHKFVHLCCDGAETIWWPQLQRYYNNDVFKLQINIDGVKAGPIGDHDLKDGWTTLCPIDPNKFLQRPWSERSINLGFCGSFGGPHPRNKDICELRDRGLLMIRERDHGDPDGYRDWLAQCRCVYNHALTGSADKMHVKARVLEASFAGALVIEMAGSPTENWFTPWEDYLPYSNADDVSKHMIWVDTHPMAAQAIAKRLRDKLLSKHTAQIFWTNVINFVKGV